MKKLVDVENEGLVGLIGQNVMLFCMNYIYSGVLAGVNERDVLLDDAHIVYETGELTAKSFKNAEKLPHSLYVRTAAVESYCASGRK